ncbi:MAG: acylphosphatase [Deltaproteobacteria bacterium]|nr:acylphosphatase [Deltaproteobacteria bacterium]
MKKHVVIQIFGRVQGVCFRAHAQKKALQLGLTGFVKNLPDASVYLEAEGEEGALQTLAEWAHCGPPAAKVTKVVVDFFDFSGTMKDFEIRYW